MSNAKRNVHISLTESQAEKLYEYLTGGPRPRTRDCQVILERVADARLAAVET